MNHGLESLKHTKTILLTTHKRDGTPIGTPVSIAFDGDRVHSLLRQGVEDQAVTQQPERQRSSRDASL